jgi:hypothetical protein
MLEDMLKWQDFMIAEVNLQFLRVYIEKIYNQNYSQYY